MSRRVAVASLMALVLLVCAKKMLPPSPDKFVPHLQDIVTRTRSQVVLVFDEDIDGTRLSPDSFRLIGPAGETLALRGASQGSSGSEVQLWTPTQEPKLYDVSGIVWDVAGNPTRFRARFRGSTRRDTIAPRVMRVEPPPGSAGRKRGVQIRVTFSEAIDTSGAAECTFVPAEYDTGFKRSWTSNWQTMSFNRLESMPSGAVVYLLVQPGAMDLEGNRVKGPAFTYFTSDTIFDAVPVKGRAKWLNGPLGTGTVLFQSQGSGARGQGPGAGESLKDEGRVTKSEPEAEIEVRGKSLRTTGLAPVLSDGSFSTKVRKGEYEVVAVADTNGDGLAELVSPPREFNTDSESLDLFLEPESIPRPINAYRR